MKIKVKNLGVLKQAEFELGDFTIICGENNTGKTYATYALFGFLSTWYQLFSVDIDTQKIEALLTQQIVKIDINDYIEKIQDYINKSCDKYTQELSNVFATTSQFFKNSSFEVYLNSQDISQKKDIIFNSDYDHGFLESGLPLILLHKTKKSTEMIVTTREEKLIGTSTPITLLFGSSPDFNEQQTGYNSRLLSFIEKIIKNYIVNIFFDFFPSSFIISSERTGAAIFRKELNFARSKLLEQMSRADSSNNLRSILSNAYEDYALPIKTNLNFIENLSTISKKNSFIVENYPDILDSFADIIGGKYTITDNDQLYYEPKGKRLKLTMDESSSAVRSLLDLGFYLRHEAKRGDLLIIDEPELNLHPENQRRVARLLARLVNLGIKVFITTHSDYIIKELNTLIMLNHDKPHLKRIAEVEGYQQNELLNADQIKVYIAEKAPVLLDGKPRKTKCQTLTPADIDPFMGIDARSFDKTIDTMNRIQSAIVWGEDCDD